MTKTFDEIIAMNKRTKEVFDEIGALVFEVAKKEGITPTEAAELIWRLSEASKRGKEAGTELHKRVEKMLSL